MEVEKRAGIGLFRWPTRRDGTGINRIALSVEKRHKALIG
jgi:hypothetical protein